MVLALPKAEGERKVLTQEQKGENLHLGVIWIGLGGGRWESLESRVQRPTVGWLPFGGRSSLLELLMLWADRQHDPNTACLKP